jgi:hypothetical protein
VTAKPSFCDWGVLYKSGVHAVKALCLTPGGLPRVDGTTERRAIASERVAEISRGHSRFTREPKVQTETGVESPCRETGQHPQSSLRCPW